MPQYTPKSVYVSKMSRKWPISAPLSPSFNKPLLLNLSDSVNNVEIYSALISYFLLESIIQSNNSIAEKFKTLLNNLPYCFLQSFLLIKRQKSLTRFSID